MSENPFIIVPYASTWPSQFLALASAIRAALGERALAIHHIGSTSVPGLASKNIIDIQLTVADVHGAEYLAALCSAGFILRDQPRRDHVPPGHADAPCEWDKRYLREPPGMHAAHLHVRAAGRANQRYALLFRDYLRGHPAAAEAYARVKLQLAAKTQRDDYIEIKDSVCDLMMQGAELWAADMCWRLPPSDA